jgi:hypothetical protein
MIVGMAAAGAVGLAATAAAAQCNVYQAGASTYYDCANGVRGESHQMGTSTYHRFNNGLEGQSDRRGPFVFHDYNNGVNGVTTETRGYWNPGERRTRDRIGAPTGYPNAGPGIGVTPDNTFSYHSFNNGVVGYDYRIGDTHVTDYTNGTSATTTTSDLDGAGLLPTTTYGEAASGTGEPVAVAPNYRTPALQPEDENNVYPLRVHDGKNANSAVLNGGTTYERYVREADDPGVSMYGTTYEEYVRVNRPSGILETDEEAAERDTLPLPRELRTPRVRSSVELPRDLQPETYGGVQPSTAQAEPAVDPMGPPPLGSTRPPGEVLFPGAEWDQSP